jgi:hypothetical protein
MECAGRFLQDLVDDSLVGMQGSSRGTEDGNGCASPSVPALLISRATEGARRWSGVAAGRWCGALRNDADMSVVMAVELPPVSGALLGRQWHVVVVWKGLYHRAMILRHHPHLRLTLGREPPRGSRDVAPDEADAVV